jgi:hypothetical protein
MERASVLTRTQNSRLTTTPDTQCSTVFPRKPALLIVLAGANILMVLVLVVVGAVIRGVRCHCSDEAMTSGAADLTCWKPMPGKGRGAGAGILHLKTPAPALQAQRQPAS